MRLQFLGTAAAEGYPGIFCDCDACNEARAMGGRSLRFRSALLVNDNLLIDFGPDLLAAAMRFNRNLSKITTALVTHAHADHFYLDNFEMRDDTFTNRLPIPTLRLYGPRDVTDGLAKYYPDLRLLRMEAFTVKAFETWQNDGYIFTAYHAYHAVDHLECLFYSVEDGQNAILYATDTGPFPEDTWQALNGKSFDVIIMEETLGPGNYSQHMGFASFAETADKMRALGMLRPGGRLIAHHFSHSGNPTHEKLEAILNPFGAEVAYDGLEVNR
jgi:phosphoribosyl 1,2-cyclic phosphate phosphodiesterase